MFLQGDIRTGLETFLVVTSWGRAAAGIKWAEARRLLNILQFPGQDGPTAQTYPVQNGKVPKVRNLCYLVTVVSLASSTKPDT